jgi:hypothetical protein
MISNKEIKRRLLGGKEPTQKPTKRLNRTKNSHKRIVNFYCGSQDSGQTEPNQPYSNVPLPPPAPTFNSILPETEPEIEEEFYAPTKTIEQEDILKAIEQFELSKNDDTLTQEEIDQINSDIQEAKNYLQGSGLFGGQLNYNPNSINSIYRMYMNRYCFDISRPPNPNSILGLYKRQYCETSPIQNVLNTITNNIRREERTEEANQHSTQQVPVIAKPLVRDYIASNPYSSTQLVPQTLQRPIAELLATSNAEHETATGEKYFIPVPPPLNTITKQNMPDLALNTTPYIHKVSEATTDRENIIELNKALQGTENKYVKSGIYDLLADIKQQKNILKKPPARDISQYIKPALNQFQINQVIQDRANQIRQQVEAEEDQPIDINHYSEDDWDGAGLKSRYSVMKGYGFKGGCGYCKKQEKQKMDLFKTMQIRNLYGF